jgi:hypothetical protein
VSAYRHPESHLRELIVIALVVVIVLDPLTARRKPGGNTLLGSDGASPYQTTSRSALRANRSNPSQIAQSIDTNDLAFPFQLEFAKFDEIVSGRQYRHNILR